MATWLDGTTDNRTASELEESIREGGGGDAQQLYAATAGQQFDIRVGSDASPDTDPNPVLKVTRTFDFDAADVTGDGVENATSIVGLSVAGPSSQIQSLGVAGLAKTTSTDATAFENNATGIYGAGWVQGSGSGVGIGGYMHGRTDSAAGKAVGLEVNVYNGSGGDHFADPDDFQPSTGLWINANGPDLVSAAITVGNGFGQQFDTGLLFNRQENNSLTGGVAFYSFRDESHAAVSIGIRGTHATAAIDIEPAAGKVSIGPVVPGGYGANTKLEVSCGGYAGADPTVWIYGEDADAIPRLHIASQAGTVEFATAATAGDLLTSTAAGDSAIRPTTSGKAVHLGGTTKVVSVSQGNGLGFHAATPVAKQTVTGSRGSNAALASLLTALATYGLITDSSS